MTPLRAIITLPDCAPDGAAFSIAGAPEELVGSTPTVWSADAGDIHLLPGGRLALGRLFARTDHRLMRTEDIAAGAPDDPAKLPAWLATAAWGAWLVVVRLPGGAWHIARDPGMFLPIFERTCDGRTLLASEVALLEAAGVAPPGVDWTALGDHLRCFAMRQRRTCLDGIDEVPPGRMVRAGSREAGVPLWTPWTFCDKPQGYERATAAEALRKEAIACVSAWVGRCDRLAVSASGGIDSSILCAALRAADAPFDCITIATADPSGDESAWVRVLADALGVGIKVRTFEPGLVDLGSPVSRGLPRPVRKGFMGQLHQLLHDACDELGARTVFDGNGGDNLFCYLHSASPVADRLWSEGPGRGTFSTFLDMCQLTSCDMGTMSGALWRRLTGPVGAVWNADHRLLSREVCDRPLPSELTPWTSRMPRCRPGKARHVGLIQQAQNFTHGLTGWQDPMRFSPLMSQPLIERALSIPSWEWCAGGINRSLAREAFGEDLPNTILERRSKAGPDSMVRAMYFGNRPLIRDMLLGGLLAPNGIVDTAAIEEALLMDEQADHPLIGRLLELIEAEAWARSWQA